MICKWGGLSEAVPVGEGGGGSSIFRYCAVLGFLNNLLVMIINLDIKIVHIYRLGEDIEKFSNWHAFLR